MVRSQLRDFPSASVAHRASYCMDVLHVTSSSAPFDWLFDAFGPIVWLRRRGFNRSGGGDRLQTYKKVFGNSKGLCREIHHPCPGRCCVNMPTSQQKFFAPSVGPRAPARGGLRAHAGAEPSRGAGTLCPARCYDASGLPTSSSSPRSAAQRSYPLSVCPRECNFTHP